MALFIRQSDNRSDLQQRLAAELQERARQKAASAKLPDGVEDSQFVTGTKRTTSLAWVWIIVIVIIVGLVIWLTIQSTTG